MTIQLNLVRASGVLYPNAKFGEQGEPKFAGFAVFDAVDGQGATTLLHVPASAWLLDCEAPLSYKVLIGGLFSGALGMSLHEELGGGKFDLEGAFGPELEWTLFGWLYRPNPKSDPHIHFTASAPSNDEPLHFGREALNL